MTRASIGFFFGLSFLLLAAGCADLGAATTTDDGLGEKDSAGHPLGAQVFEGPTCDSEIGQIGEKVVRAPAGAAGTICSGTTDYINRATITINARAQVTETCSWCLDTAFTLIATDEEGVELGRRDIAISEFFGAGQYQDFSLDVHVTTGQASVRVVTTGRTAVQLEYVEVFGSMRRIALITGSGVVQLDSDLRLEVHEPGANSELRFRCNDLDVTHQFQASVRAGETDWQETDFRWVIETPFRRLLEGCSYPAMLEVELVQDGEVLNTNEIYLLKEPIECPPDDGRPLAVVSGFVPFWAGSPYHNSSREAVLGFDPNEVPEARIMQLELPVEFTSAADILLDVAHRCEADIVIGFGQGIGRVDLETTAFNEPQRLGTLGGGSRDNRGYALDPRSEIRAGGAATIESRLPLAAIARTLDAGGVVRSIGPYPGRYVCNNLFYSIMHDTPEHVIAGFIHLPIRRQMDSEDRINFEFVVETAIRASVRALP